MPLSSTKESPVPAAYTVGEIKEAIRLLRASGRIAVAELAGMELLAALLLWVETDRNAGLDRMVQRYLSSLPGRRPGYP